MKAGYAGTNGTFDTRFEYYMDRMTRISVPGESRIYFDNFEEIIQKMVSRAESDPRNLVVLEQYVDEQLSRYARLGVTGKGTQGRYDALRYTKSALEHSRMMMMDRISNRLRGGKE